MDKQYGVHITQYAEQSMRDISHYIAFELMAPDAAVRLLQMIRKEISSLKFMPDRIHLTPDEPWRAMGLHRMRVKNYYVYFWIDEEKDLVYVTDVMYVRRDQKTQLEFMPLNDEQ